jgi:thiol-disulfide isomerase/thioredoxin
MNLLRSILIILTVCSSAFAQINHYEINGDIKNIPAKQVFLHLLKFHPVSNQPYVTKVDSAEIIQGKFLLKKDSNILEPSWAATLSYLDTTSNKKGFLSFYNSFDQSKQGNFILENATIKIEGNHLDKKGLLISGSKETDFYFKYADQLWQYLKTQAVDKKIETLKKSKNNKELAHALKEKENIILDFKLNLEKIFRENPNRYLSILFLHERAELFKVSELKAIYSSLANDYKNTSKAIKLNDVINQKPYLEKGGTFPNFAYNNRNGKVNSLENLKGKNGTLVVFWASWCGPCRQEIPELKKLHKTYQAKGINFISISIDHDKAKWEQALTLEKMPWPNLANLPGDFKEIKKKYNLYAIPSMFLLDDKGKVVMADESDISILKTALSKL